MTSSQSLDLVIVGTGPAGLTAALYAARYKLNALSIGQIDGGLMSEAHKICNFPTELSISGLDLTSKMKANALSQGAIIENGKVKDITKGENSFEVILDNKEKYFTKTILLATGTKHRQLGLKNENKFIGRGISYCATCDGMLFKNKIVAVIGGSDSALTSALYLAEIASKVYIIYRGKALRGEPAWLEKINNKKNIEIILNTNLKNLIGEEKLISVELDQPYQNQPLLNLDGIFVEIGTEPDDGDYIKNLGIELDNNNYIKVDSSQKTNIRGIWAAGDITNASNNFRQIITACAEGAIAAESINRYIQLL